MRHRTTVNHDPEHLPLLRVETVSSQFPNKQDLARTRCRRATRGDDARRRPGRPGVVPHRGRRGDQARTPGHYRVTVTVQEQDAASTEPNRSRASGWHDDPIKKKAEDKLNRAPVAERLAGLITSNHSPESSIVYGLEGPWGCGKSSVIAMLTELLEDREDWRVAFFTPWATAGTNGMISEFFASLLNAVPDSGTAKREELRKSVARCMMVARPFMPLIPKVGPALNGAAEVIEDSLEKSWEQCFGKLSKELRELGISILVVVDDIDRLQVDELLDLLKVVRLLGRFPGVDYLLAYDEQSLIEILRSPDRGGLSQARARSFMEKIVQYPLSLPPLLTGQIIKILTTRLNELLSSGRLGAGLDGSRMGGIIGTTMPSQLRTPRAIERFLAQANEEIGLHDPGEIDCADLLLTAFLRVQFPDVFSRLQDWKERLTTGDPPKEGKAAWSPLLGSLEERDKQDALSTLEAIFPAVAGGGVVEGSSPRFANRLYFDRYLAQTIPDGDVPDADVRGALERAADGEQEDLMKLLQDADDDRSYSVLAKISSWYPEIRMIPYRNEPAYRDETFIPVTPALLKASMELLSSWPDDANPFDTRSMMLDLWAVKLLLLLADKDSSDDLCEALSVCQSLDRRIGVIKSAAGESERLDPESCASKKLMGMLERETGQLMPMLLKNLRDRDGADTDVKMAYLLTHVRKHSPSTRDELVKGIREGIENGEFSPEDVAARLVGRSPLRRGCGNQRSASFDGRLFTELTGIQARSTDDRCSPEVSMNDSWEGRRGFAVQFIRVPSERSDEVADRSTG